MLNYSVSDFKIVRFFSYTSCITYDSILLGSDANNYKYYPNFNRKFDKFYTELADEALRIASEEGLCGKYSNVFSDNKTVFQIRHKKTGKTYFIGRKDWSRNIGDSCVIYFGYIYDFVDMKKSDYIDEIVFANKTGLFKRFTI